MGPYREMDIAPELACPRCKQRVPALDVAACRKGCGTWVSAFAATEILSDDECRPDPVTRWWRKREPCPICGEQMTLRGAHNGHFQGCDGHGFWLDSDAIQHTGLGRGVDEARLDRKRNDEARVLADREARHVAEHKREREKREKEIREANVAELIGEGALDAVPPDILGAVARAVGHTRYLDDRINALEARNQQLEKRIATLERALRPRR